MAHAILISDHIFLSETMKINLQVYLSCKVVVIKDVPTLVQLISIDQTYDFILCLSTIAKKDITNEVYKVHQKYMKSSPLVFLGHVNILPYGVFNVVDPFEILTIVRTLAKELKWTAKDLINRIAPEYIPIPVRLLMETKIAIDDLYWKSTSQTDPYVLVSSYQDNIEGKIAEWNNNKITELYIKAENRLRAMGDLNKVLIKSLSASIDNPQIEDVAKLQDSSELFSQYFSDPEAVHQLPDEVRQELGKLANKTVELVSELTLKVPPSLTKMIELFQKSPSEFIPRHSFLATYFAIEMIKAESWYSHQVHEKVCILLFFHDIILLPIYQKHPDLPEDEDMLLSTTILSEKDKQLVKWHPKLIAQILAQIPGLPVGLDQLIMQHHGTLNGDAGSDELQEDVSLLAKVILVAESFTTELLKSKLPLNKGTRELILKKLGIKFKKRSYYKLISNLERFEL